MSAKTNYYENLLNDCLFRSDATARAEINAARLTVGLFKTALSESSVLASGANPVTDAGYSVISNATLAAAFGTVSSAGTIANTGALTWGPFTGAPGTIVAVGWIDATTGKIWFYYNLSVSITPSAGSTLRYAAASLSIQEA